METIRRLILSVILMLVILVPVFGWACDAMGPNRHVGVVTKIDQKTATFTIIDAQMQKPMIFTGTEKILDALKLNRNFIITYTTEDNQMKAEAVVAASGR